MKPGTIVVCLRTEVAKSLIPYIKWLPVMDEKTPYMIRDNDECPINGKGVRFEEGMIGITKEGHEFIFPLDRVREILPPGEISEEIKEVLEQENLISN